MDILKIHRIRLEEGIVECDRTLVYKNEYSESKYDELIKSYEFEVIRGGGEYKYEFEVINDDTNCVILRKEMKYW